MIKPALMLLVPAVLLGGCVSSLTIEKYDPSIQQVGYPHRLRFTQYSVTLTWRVVSCDATQPQPLKLKLSADIKEASALDPDQFYVVDPRSMQGLFRTTEFNMEWYEDRTTKSVTSSVDDQTGAALGSVLTGVSKLAGAGLLGAGAGTVSCPAEVMAALKAINGTKGDPNDLGQKAITEKAEQAVADQTLVVTRLTAAAAAAGATLDEKERKALRVARATLVAYADRLAAEQAKLKELSEVVTDSRSITWPDTGSVFAGGPYKPSAAAYKRWQLNEQDKAAMMWFRLVRLDVPDVPGGDVADAPAAPTQGAPSSPAPVDGSPDFGGSTGRPAPVATATPAPRRWAQKAPGIPGLPYREPMRVRLDICNGGPCSGSLDDVRGTDLLVATKDGLALQGGPLLYLPFRAQTFAHIKNSAGFAQSGVLTSGGSSQLRGAGTGVADTFKAGSEQVAGISDGLRTAETKRLEAAIAQAKARKSLAELEAVAPINPNADMQAQILALQTEATLATAEKSLLDARAALEASRALAGE